jgi:hypothetical protein
MDLTLKNIMHIESYKNKLIKIIDDAGDFVFNDDGYIYYFPKELNGYLSSHQLRFIADELDKRNKPWDDSIAEYFANHPNKN